ncbi:MULTISPECIES: peroxiredoxin [unclassified Brenneria]|uniref:peroxiredoxin n=1 Tax=unclassified Brenneria TaxID=2634434 RepID=UPI0029C2D652|nr:MULTISPECIES: peroxiredoxin [unclassified Brenneria]MDX5628358.1 peroxiredoxin [Brenneria sp. L3-3Z]MDX5695459.1 peroxiredoxin [Brenneria sp. L4-2C]MEE3662308.1 peroxiredoxin [Brenneria sp. g21c3]
MIRTEQDTPSPDCSIPPFLYDEAPDFVARSTHGDIRLSDYRGRWVLLFSHPADFTPVCTSELIAFAQNVARFEALNCQLLGLSVDGLYSHLAWLNSIKVNFNVDIPFPLIEDPSMAVARAFGMLSRNSHSSGTVRGTFLIDPKGVIQSINWYPISTGRSIQELLRQLEAIKLSYELPYYTPAEWQPGEDIIVPPPRTVEGALARLGDDNAPDWYYKTCTNPQSAEKGNPR